MDSIIFTQISAEKIKLRYYIVNLKLLAFGTRNSNIAI